ncbi:LOW QUALITY PROTEIN: mitotic checkpoint serine/threonine-protein kinase BUB1 [Fundulus diaphanus]
MDIAALLQHFEETMSAYSGDDPLDPWDKFVDFLEQRQPAAGGMALVFDALVQRFLGEERYADDLRYITYCIRCAAYYSDPADLYAQVFSKGVGTRTAALYVAWAQQLEQAGGNQAADAVYQKAVENRAQPADVVLHEYKQFQSRTRTQPPPSGARVPLQNSQMTNQTSPLPPGQNQASADCPSKPPANRTVITVSRSETSGTLPSGPGASAPVVSQYNTAQLACEGSEFCFEEVRAKNYWRKIREEQEEQQRRSSKAPFRHLRHDGAACLRSDTPVLLSVAQKLSEQEDEIQRLKDRLERVTQELEACRGSQVSCRCLEALYRVGSDPVHVMPVSSAAPCCCDQLQAAPARLFTPPTLTRPRSLGLRLHAELSLIREAGAAPSPEALRLVRSDGATAAEPGPSNQTDPSLTGPAGVQAAWVQLASDALQTSELSAADPDGSPVPEPEEKLDASQGGMANLSHATPNTSLGLVQATPSRVLPSPTVNTLEAMGVIMDMFQAPTFLDEPSEGASKLHLSAEKDLDMETSGKKAGSLQTGAGWFCSAVLTRCSPVLTVVPLPKPTTPFTIFQDEEDKGNGRAAAPSESSKPVKAVGGTRADKPNETPADLMPDESTTWGARYNFMNSLAACPNSTSDFAMLPSLVSTPFTHKAAAGSFQAEEHLCKSGDTENLLIRRQTKKLSPILEQSPSDDNAAQSAARQLLPSSAAQGTIMADGSASSSLSVVQPPPPAVLSFRDHTLCPTEEPGWEEYAGPRGEPFQILEDPETPAEPEPVHNPVWDVPMSPQCVPKVSWLDISSPVPTAEQDLDVFLSPRRPSHADAASARTRDVPMSPEPPRVCADVPMSPERVGVLDEPMTSPDRGLRAELQLLSDPWDAELISGLLSRLCPPLTSHPCCVTWPFAVPTIGPKRTLSMGNSSLRVDCVLGEGAFATVYQATNPETSEKMVLKVQKPANPWEFYINTCLDARLQPAVRHLFGSIRSAHLFPDGSVMLAELHNYGTLLNAVNVYRTLSEKVMPQPLVLYFAVCILRTVELLHAARLIHADIKPDNLVLGQRFLDNRSLDPDSLDHGLVLIDLGQSIDMQLFPEGTAFTARCRTSGFQCTEMLSGKPWTYQTDYFGIAGTVFCMLFGTYMQVQNQGGVWTTNAVFRRNPHSDLWLEFFHTLLNVPDCGSLPSLQNLRCRLTAVLQQNYSSKLATLKNRLVVKLLENHRAGRR